MKVVILAGGFGTRFSEETSRIPKPMIEIGDKPILWHIMKTYSSYGFNEFIICLGYKGYVIKEYFANYFLHNSDAVIDMETNSIKSLNTKCEPWKVTLVDTGLNTSTGGRIKRVAKYIGNETFMMTYGDGVSNVDINKLLEFHRKNKRLATLTAVQPAGRFGMLKLENNLVTHFAEKKDNADALINGGFFVLDPKVLSYIKNDESAWEAEALETLSHKGQLSGYVHDGFWMCMDKLYDKIKLEELWNSGKCPWKVWKDCD